MGIGGISIWQLLIILAIVIMLFGTKRLRSLGGDLGSAIKGFKKAMHEDPEPGKLEKNAEDNSDQVIDNESEQVKREKSEQK